MKTKVPTKEIDQIIERFDFVTVRKVMRFLNWQLAHEGSMVIPTTDMLKATARELLNLLRRLNKRA